MNLIIAKMGMCDYLYKRHYRRVARALEWMNDEERLAYKIGYNYAKYNS